MINGSKSAFERVCGETWSVERSSRDIVRENEEKIFISTPDVTDPEPFEMEDARGRIASSAPELLRSHIANEFDRLGECRDCGAIQRPHTEDCEWSLLMKKARGE